MSFIECMPEYSTNGSQSISGNFSDVTKLPNSLIIEITCVFQNNNKILRLEISPIYCLHVNVLANQPLSSSTMVFNFRCS